MNWKFLDAPTFCAADILVSRISAEVDRITKASLDFLLSSNTSELFWPFSEFVSCTLASLSFHTRDQLSAPIHHDLPNWYFVSWRFFYSRHTSVRFILYYQIFILYLHKKDPGLLSEKLKARFDEIFPQCYLN